MSTNVKLSTVVMSTQTWSRNHTEELLSTSPTVSQMSACVNTQYEEHVWVRIDLKGHDKLLVGCVYHPVQS